MTVCKSLTDKIEANKSPNKVVGKWCLKKAEVQFTVSLSRPWVTGCAVSRSGFCGAEIEVASVYQPFLGSRCSGQRALGHYRGEDGSANLASLPETYALLRD